MGDHSIVQDSGADQEHAFIKALLGDLTALERMLAEDRIERGLRRIGAEQEMFLVDRAFAAAPVAGEVLERAGDARLTTEIGRFNLEANVAPRHFGGRCLGEMEAELNDLVRVARNAAAPCGAEILLAGILPTVRLTDLGLDNLTPHPRYQRLNQAATRLRGGAFDVHIKGLDELRLTHDNVMLEACCTSFQVHFQVGAAEFASLYNLAQAVAAPVLAAAANSPLLLGHRLWHETRVALFQHSVDERSGTRRARGAPPRVSFGGDWVKQSVLEVFREDVARFRTILAAPPGEDAQEVLDRGGTPRLAALRLHNGTVWRWNRPCYGVTDGRPHLRIEARALPAGPTVQDEVANAAFFFGLMAALGEEYGAIDRVMAFDDAKDNFFAAARYGLQAQFAWVGGRRYPAAALILDHLLPLARAGLKQAGIAPEDTDRYLSTVEERVCADQTGAQWALRSLGAMGGQGTRELRHQALAATTLAHQKDGTPVHRWPPARVAAHAASRPSYQTVDQFMSTDLFTVGADDPVDLAASVMDWKHVRHVPVEDDAGRLVGLVSHRDLLRLLAQGKADGRRTVRDIMKPHPVTATPRTPTREAMALMQDRRVGCLPVVEDDRLVGIVTAYDFLALAAGLIEEHLADGGGLGAAPVPAPAEGVEAVSP
jgi:CBS domain-containing protein/gamma-glutamyl:cysteine ligase YbdK (ATP-grasp superfamily)